jgi:membrane-bound lytic murein transglycosylase B
MDYRQLAYQTAQKYGIDPDLFVRQIQAESAFRPDAVSSAGAIGLGQLMPATAKELGVDPTDPAQNLEGAARYMKQQLDRFGDPALALAAYNAGPSRVAKANGVPNITETQNYVAKILGGKGGAAMAQEPQKQPQGLLGGLLGGQGIGGALGMSEDFRDRLAMGIMAGSDPRQFAPLIQQRAAGMKERKVASRAKAQANATADYLEKIGQADIANLLRQGGIDAKTALAAGTSKTKETADIQEYRLAQSQGYKGTFEAWQQLGKKKTEFGTIPVGYQLVEGVTPDGQPTYQMVPVEGSPAYIEEQERRRKQAKKGEGGDIMATNVLQTAGRARNLTSGWTVGYGQLLAGLPATDAREIKAEVDALQAIASSENLNRMRQESPTGGALGNVSDADIKLLKDKSGALDPMSKPEVFAKQLDEYELLLLQTIHGTEAGTKLFNQTRGMYGQYSFEVEGQTSDKNAQNRSRFPNAPDIGTVSQGHVYNGGDPSEPKNWSAQ